MQGAVSIEITEIIWICNVMGFFFKIGKQMWESTKWISWKEFAQTGSEKVCDKVIINKLE
jgi:hypothetical protein